MMVFDWDGRHISNAFSYSYEKATRKLVAFGQGHIGVHFMAKAHSRTTTGRVLARTALLLHWRRTVLAIFRYKCRKYLLWS